VRGRRTEINASGGTARAIACHIGDMDALQSLFARIKEDYGASTSREHAATNPYYGHVLDTDLGAFQKTVDVNIRATSSPPCSRTHDARDGRWLDINVRR